MNAVVAKQIRTTVEARLRELQPALAEYEQLLVLRREYEQLLGVLALLDDPAAAGLASPPILAARPVAPPAPGTPVTPLRNRRSRRGSRRGRDGRAPQGENKQKILAAIAANPGIAAPKIAAKTGLKRTVVASTITRMKHTGELVPYGGGVRLPTPFAASPDAPPAFTPAAVAAVPELRVV
jgi:hypothetical protein